MYLYNWKFDENYEEKIQRITKNVTNDIEIYTEEYFTTCERISIQQSLNELDAENVGLLL